MKYNRGVRTAFFPIGITERRLIRLKEGFGNHMADYGRDLGGTYFKSKKGILDRAGSAAMAGLSVIFEGTDQLYDALMGREYVAPKGLLGRIQRDTWLLLKDVFTLHPLRAAGDIWRLATSDLILDGGDLITGNRLNTRNAAMKVLAA